MDTRGLKTAEGSENARRHDCTAQGIYAGFVGLGVSSVIGAGTTYVLNQFWPSWRAWNWRPKLILVAACGVAGFWIRGEQTMYKCIHQGDEEFFRLEREKYGK